MAHLIGACSPDLQRQAPGFNLSVLTLNLHTYQELQTADTDESDLTSSLARQRVERYGPIFDRIAAGIDELDPDIICFQEVGEWSGRTQDDPDSVEFGATDTNMVRQILLRLGNTRYYYTMDWSHYGWEVWMEGSAILSKYPIARSDSRFVSNPQNGRYESWRSRNVPMAELVVPVIGRVAVFSVHTGWWDDPEEPSREQLRRLLEWVEEDRKIDSATILCGDFNAPAGGPAHTFLTRSGFVDTYALVNPDGFFDATVGPAVDGWEDEEKSQRIDYILLHGDSPLDVSHGRRVFTDEEFGRVSDHIGVYVEFAIKQ